MSSILMYSINSPGILSKKLAPRFWQVGLFISLFLWINLAIGEQPGIFAPTKIQETHPTNNAFCVDNGLSYWAAILGWMPTATSPQHLCGGYYAESADMRAHPHPAPMGDVPMNISSTGQVDYNLNGHSTLEGNVTMLQPGREIKADRAALIPDTKTRKIAQMDLEGHVRYQEAGKLIVGKTSHIDLEKKSIIVNQGAYHLVRETKTGMMDTWGIAEEAHRESALLSWFKKSTYTTCSPNSPSWYLKSWHLVLDETTGRGKAKHVLLYAKKIPIFYTPYLSFPIDKRRYSGFLYPSFGYNNQFGSFIALPYYFNLAPNNDDTLTLKQMSKRGLLTNNLFRYLTQKNSGYFELGFIPNDQGFRRFKTDEAQLYPPNSYNNPFLNALNNSSNNRSSIGFHNSTVFNTHWAASVDINHASDDYYFQDFGSDFSGINTNQLLNQGFISYQDQHWQFSGRIQDWQTLHQINQTFVEDQYRRLPELNLSSFWPEGKNGFVYGFNSQWVNFDHVNDFFSGLPYPTGSRLHLNPEVSLPINKDAGFLIPRLALDATDYSVIHNQIINANNIPPTVLPTDATLNTVRALPIFSMDSGFYFDRYFSIAHHAYQQTLEPRLFYLFVPEKNQYDIPIFDTSLPPFGFDTLFRTNRFMGYDRVGDANQISLGLTSRILDQDTGQEKLNTGIGMIYYFHKHTVCLYPDCSDDTTVRDKASPIAGKFTYEINNQFSLIGNAAWDPNTRQMNNDDLSLHYFQDSRRIINIGYNYVQQGDILNSENLHSSENNLNRINLSLNWPLPKTSHWNVISVWNYNISHQHPQTYLYGLEYENCCWAVRLVSSKVLQSENSLGNATFQSAYYVQFMLKGLGAIGNTNSALLTNNISGYQDAFKSG